MSGEDHAVLSQAMDPMRFRGGVDDSSLAVTCTQAVLRQAVDPGRFQDGHSMLAVVDPDLTHTLVYEVVPSGQTALTLAWRLASLALCFTGLKCGFSGAVPNG